MCMVITIRAVGIEIVGLHILQPSHLKFTVEAKIFCSGGTKCPAEALVLQAQ